MNNPKIIRFPPCAALKDAQPRSLFERLITDMRRMREVVRQWFRPEPKPKRAPIFKVNNPTQWKLERVRRKARERL